MNKNNKRGGVIGEIPDDKIFEQKSKKSITKQSNKFIDTLKIKNNDYVKSSESIILGSYGLKIQPYPSDIDLVNRFLIESKNFKMSREILARSLQNVVREILLNGYFFTDAKIGTYNDGDNVHWTAREILNGFRDANSQDFNGHIGAKNLIEAVGDYSLIKIDMTVPYLDRYIEVTCNYLPQNLDNDFKYTIYISNIDNIKTIIKRDAKKQLDSGKLFKLVKRIFSQARINDDIQTARPLYNILTSNVSLISSIVSDLKSIELLLFLNQKIDKRLISMEFESMKDELATIIDIKFDENVVFDLFKNIEIFILNNYNAKSIELLKILIDYLNSIVNKETMEYFKKINFKIPRKYI